MTTCPSCSATNSPDAKFCAHCGIEFGKTPADQQDADQPQDPTPAPATSTSPSKKGTTNWLVVGLIVALVIIAAMAAWSLLGKGAQASGNATPTPPAAAAPAPMTPVDPASSGATSGNLTAFSRGETREVPAGEAVLGDVVATWPGFAEVMSAYDNGTSGEGTIVWVSAGKASIHAPWGAGVLACSSRDEAIKLVNNELSQGCGDPGGCRRVRLVTLSSNGTSVEFFDK